MAFLKPKTDWYGFNINGKYQGDYFNYEDYNRIINNLNYLSEYIEINYDIKTDALETKTINDFMKAEDMNLIVNTLRSWGENIPGFTAKSSDIRTYVQRGRTMTFDELNKIEADIEFLYSLFVDQFFICVSNSDTEEYILCDDENNPIYGGII